MFEDCSKTTEWNLASAKDQIPYIDPNVASFMTLKGPNLNRVGFFFLKASYWNLLFTHKKDCTLSYNTFSAAHKDMPYPQNSHLDTLDQMSIPCCLEPLIWLFNQLLRNYIFNQFQQRWTVGFKKVQALAFKS